MLTIPYTLIFVFQMLFYFQLYSFSLLKLLIFCLVFGKTMQVTTAFYDFFCLWHSSDPFSVHLRIYRLSVLIFNSYNIKYGLVHGSGIPHIKGIIYLCSIELSLDISVGKHPFDFNQVTS